MIKIPESNLTVSDIIQWQDDYCCNSYLNISTGKMQMNRIFPDAIEAYNKWGTYDSLSDAMEDKLYQEYLELRPTIQEFFRCVSNKKAIEAGVKMGIVSKSKKRANKKKIITLRRIMNLFRIIASRQPDEKDPAPSWTSIYYGFYGTNSNGYPIGVWLEYLWNPLDVFAGSILHIEDDDPYQLAIAIADLYRIKRWEEFCELSKKYPVKKSIFQVD